MRIIVINTLDDLADDMAAIPVKGAEGFAWAVRGSAEFGNRMARRFAQDAAGPHGTNYYKRITAEAITPLMWEYGPEGDPKTEFVGAGYRHSAPNMDLPNSADLAGPKLEKAVDSVLDRLFW